MSAVRFEHLQREAAARGIPLTDAHIARFETYLDVLLRWNARINLTAVTEPQAILERHFLDSLAVTTVLQGPGRLIDVGSGPGFPGVPIAIVRPDVQVTLLEPARKKGAFLRALVHELQTRVVVEDRRLEDLLRPGSPAGPGSPLDLFDWAVSRATFPPRDWVSRGQPLVRPGGLLVAMTGREEPPPPATRIVRYQLPGGEQRHLGIYKRST